MAIRAKVKKAFAYARDGIHSRQMQVGEVDDFAEDVFAGLEAAGQVEKTGDAVSAPNAEPDWSVLGDNELVSMIRAHTGESVIAGNMSHEALVGMARRAFASGVPVPSVAPKAPEIAEAADGKAKSAGRGSKA